MKLLSKTNFWIVFAAALCLSSVAHADDSTTLKQFPGTEVAPGPIDFPKVQNSLDEEQAKRFSWWGTSGAKPAPFKDPERSGYWWWPQVAAPATAQTQAPDHASNLWGNQGWVYVRKVIFDYKSETGPMRSSLIIKKIIKNVKVYFDYDKSAIRDDAREALNQAIGTLDRNPKADILITGNADTRGSEQYNMKLGNRRADAVKDYLISQGLPQDRIKILSRGKLDAIASKGDLVGMQKDRNAQFMIAEVEEVKIPADKAAAFGEAPGTITAPDTKTVEEQKQYEGAIKVDVKEYVIKKGDTLWAIAQKEYGDGKQWKRIYDFNKEVIKNPNRPKKGTKIKLPIE